MKDITPVLSKELTDLADNASADQIEQISNTIEKKVESSVTEISFSLPTPELIKFSSEASPLFAYAITRLVRGLCSGRQNVIEGFSTCLTHLLATRDPSIHEQVLSGVIAQTKPRGAPLHLENLLLGRLFGVLAIQKAAAFKNSLDWEETKNTVEKIWQIYDSAFRLRYLAINAIYLIFVDSAESKGAAAIELVEHRIREFLKRSVKENAGIKRQKVSSNNSGMLDLLLRLRMYVQATKKGTLISGNLVFNEGWLTWTDLMAKCVFDSEEMMDVLISGLMQEKDFSVVQGIWRNLFLYFREGFCLFMDKFVKKVILYLRTCLEGDYKTASLRHMYRSYGIRVLSEWLLHMPVEYLKCVFSNFPTLPRLVLQKSCCTKDAADKFFSSLKLRFNYDGETCNKALSNSDFDIQTAYSGSEMSVRDKAEMFLSFLASLNQQGVSKSNVLMLEDTFSINKKEEGFWPDFLAEWVTQLNTPPSLISIQWVVDCLTTWRGSMKELDVVFDWLNVPPSEHEFVKINVKKRLLSRLSTYWMAIFKQSVSDSSVICFDLVSKFLSSEVMINDTSIIESNTFESVLSEARDLYATLGSMKTKNNQDVYLPLGVGGLMLYPFLVLIADYSIGLTEIPPLALEEVTDFVALLGDLKVSLTQYRNKREETLQAFVDLLIDLFVQNNSMSPSGGFLRHVSKIIWKQLSNYASTEKIIEISTLVVTKGDVLSHDTDGSSQIVSAEDDEDVLRDSEKEDRLAANNDDELSTCSEEDIPDSEELSAESAMSFLLKEETFTEDSTNNRETNNKLKEPLKECWETKGRALMILSAYFGNPRWEKMRGILIDLYRGLHWTLTKSVQYEKNVEYVQFCSTYISTLSKINISQGAICDLLDGVSSDAQSLLSEIECKIDEIMKLAKKRLHVTKYLPAYLMAGAALLTYLFKLETAVKINYLKERNKDLSQLSKSYGVPFQNSYGAACLQREINDFAARKTRTLSLPFFKFILTKMPEIALFVDIPESTKFFPKQFKALKPRALPEAYVRLSFEDSDSFSILNVC